MARCPNCGQSLALAALECLACNATFEGGDAWKPVAESLAEQAAAAPAKPVEVRASRSGICLAIAALAAALYCTSLVMPALLFARRAPLLGYQVLLWGWWGPLAGNFAWFANPVFIFASIKFLRGFPGRAAALGLLAAALAATSPLAKEWWFSEAAGTQIVGLGVGFRTWLSAIVVFVVAATLAAIQRKPSGEA